LYSKIRRESPVAGEKKATPTPNLPKNTAKFLLTGRGWGLPYLPNLRGDPQLEGGTFEGKSTSFLDDVGEIPPGVGERKVLTIIKENRRPL